MYVKLNEEFHRLRKTGLKFSSALLGTLAKYIIKSNDGEFNADFRDVDGKLIYNKVGSNIQSETQHGRLRSNKKVVM